MDSDALKRLIEAVEAGSVRPYVIEEMAAPMFHHSIWPNIAKSYGGDLNAAKALHDALLPGWTACVGQNAHHGDWNAFVRLADNGGISREHWGGTDDNAARSWLLAILRAKLAENNLTTCDETSV